MKVRFFLIAYLLSFVYVADTFSAPLPYYLAKKIRLEGDVKWDFLTIDPSARRLYVTRSTHVSVIDIDRRKLVGDIPDTPGVHGVALAQEKSRGFTSNGEDNTVTVFELSSLKQLSNIHVGTKPDAILYDHYSKYVFTFNGVSKDSTVIDARTLRVLGTIALGGKPESVVSDEHGHLYVNIEDTSEVLKIDTKLLTVLKRWPLAPCREPSGLAIDNRAHRLFSTCLNKVMVVVNTDLGRVIAHVPIGGYTDGAVYDPETRLIFSSNGEGTLTVIKQVQEDRYEVVSDVPTLPGARTIALDPKTHILYSCTANEDPNHPSSDIHKHNYLPGSLKVLLIAPILSNLK